MTYAQIDDRFDEHPKYLRAGWDLEMYGLQICAITYANRHLTDGFVPRSAVARFGLVDTSTKLRRNLRLASKLIADGFWRETDGGYEIVGFLDHNPSKEEIVKRRAELHDKRSAAGRLGGIARQLAKQKQVATGLPEHDLAKPKPSPLRSSPLRSKEKKETLGADAPTGDHQRVVACYFAEYERAKKAKPGFTARTGKAAKDLLAVFSADDACAVIRGAFTDEFFLKARCELWDISANPNRFPRVPAPRPIAAPQLSLAPRAAAELVPDDVVRARLDKWDAEAATGFEEAAEPRRNVP